MLSPSGANALAVHGGCAAVSGIFHPFSDGPWVTVAEHPTSMQNWRALVADQDRLRSTFGDTRAHPDPDLRPEFNDDS